MKSGFFYMNGWYIRMMVFTIRDRFEHNLAVL